MGQVMTECEMKDPLNGGGLQSVGTPDIAAALVIQYIREIRDWGVEETSNVNNE